MSKQNQRQVAIKLRIADILGGQYIKEEGWNPNYVLTRGGKKASRVNLLGTVVSIPTAEINYRSMALDDGSGKIPVRSFDESDLFHGVGLGDVVFVVGRPRQYGNEIYIMPEIIKKLQNKLWIDIRKLEIEKNSTKDSQETESASNENAQKEELNVKEEIVDENKNSEKSKIEESINNIPVAQQKIYSIIKELDKGEGAEFEQVLEKAGGPDAEKIISQLLMEGEIFELSKGKLKVLE